MWVVVLVLVVVTGGVVFDNNSIVLKITLFRGKDNHQRPKTVSNIFVLYLRDFLYEKSRDSLQNVSIITFNWFHNLLELIGTLIVLTGLTSLLHDSHLSA